MALTSNTDGFDRKMKLIMAAFGPNGFFGNIGQDALTFLRDRIDQETLNRDSQARGRIPSAREKGTRYIRSISGNLRRAYNGPPLRQLGPYTYALLPNIGIAPYVGAVNEKVRDRTGSDFTELTAGFYAPEINEAIAREFKLMIDTIQKGKSYTYANPFYD